MKEKGNRNNEVTIVSCNSQTSCIEGNLGAQVLRPKNNRRSMTRILLCYSYVCSIRGFYMTIEIILT